MDREMVVVLDFGGQYNQLIARRVRECNVYCEVHPYTMSVAEDVYKRQSPFCAQLFLRILTLCTVFLFLGLDFGLCCVGCRFHFTTRKKEPDPNSLFQPDSVRFFITWNYFHLIWMCWEIFPAAREKKGLNLAENRLTARNLLTR